MPDEQGTSAAGKRRANSAAPGEAVGVKALGGKAVGVATRSVFVVDGDGRVTYAWVAENPGILPPFDEIVEAVQAVA